GVGIHGDRQTAGIGAATDIAGVENLVACGVDLHDKAVTQRIPGLHDGRAHCREVDRVRFAGEIRVAVFVHGDRVYHFAEIAADVGGVDHHRIDHQRQRAVVRAEAEWRRAPWYLVRSRNHAALTTDFLISDRLAMHQGAAAERELELAGVVHANVVGAIEADGDRVRSGSRRNHEVIFKLAFHAVVYEVDALVYAAIAHAVVVRDAAAPLSGVPPDEVVAAGRIGVQRIDAYGGVAPLQRHAQSAGCF